MNINKSLIIGIDYSPDTDTAVLVVGKKVLNKEVEVINVIQGTEAIDLYYKLKGKESPKKFSGLKMESI